MAAAEKPAAPILRLPNELLLNIVSKVIEPALTKNVLDNAKSAYRVITIDAGLDKYKDQMLAELYRFTACKKLYAAAKDVLCTRKNARLLEASYLLDYYGQSIFRIRGTLGNHTFCHENTEKLNLILRYQIAPQTGRIIEEPDYLLEVLEGVLLKCNALKRLTIEVKPHTPEWF